jgi:hypothetical protein
MEKEKKQEENYLVTEKKVKVRVSEWAFQKGWFQLRQHDISGARNKLMTELRITTRPAFLDRMNGVIEPKVSEYKAIEEIFGEYGIKDIWGTV